MMEMDYKKAFEWVCEQIDTEMKFTEEDIEENGYSDRLLGMKFAYGSIKELCDNIKKYGVDEYERMCEEVSEKYAGEI